MKVILAVLIGAALGMIAPKLGAEPIFEANGEGVTIQIHKEACTLAEVKNLPRRATWTERGKTFEGCAGLDQNLGIVLAFFVDRTVVALPLQVFQRVVGV